MPTTHEDGRLLSWASSIEPQAFEQAARTARLPIIPDGEHVALMPDAHFGIGATVGSVIPTEGAIIPAAVGVDIGCGMIATLTSATADDLPDSLDALVTDLHTAIPAGVGKGHEGDGVGWDDFRLTHGGPSDDSLTRRAGEQFGTLGSGNHFAEVCLDQPGNVWLLLHSGSRSVGNRLATMHIDTAKGLAENLEQSLEDPDLAWFTQGTPEFEAYMGDLLWAQVYAFKNRAAMMTAFLDVLRQHVPNVVGFDPINCHHNYSALEDVGGRQLWITRKGAIGAHEGQMGIIPGSMGTASYIVRGKGNPASYQSCSHGAGRRMSRGQAKRTIPVADFEASMAGVGSWQRGHAAELLDEAPAAYKDIDVVMADQDDLVETVATLHQIANYKGVDPPRRKRKAALQAPGEKDKEPPHRPAVAG